MARKTPAPTPIAPSNGLVEHLLHEDRVFRPLPSVLAGANLNPTDLAQARQKAEADEVSFWEEAAEELSWFRNWERVLDESNPPFYRWFKGARCNIAYNCLNRHVLGHRKNKLALIWEGEPGEVRKYTYYELTREVARLANGLRELGVRRGDRVVIYASPLPETVAAMLACATLGAVHVLVFAGFSAKALAGRIAAVNARHVITVDGFYRNGQVVRLKPIVDEALALSAEAGRTVTHTVVIRRSGVETGMLPGRDVWYADLVRGQKAETPVAPMETDEPLFILHTSGTTGAPKGVVHGHGGYMVGVHRTMSWVFDVTDTDIFWCTADPAWITGHSYTVYGPLLAGATCVLYEGHPLYPEPGRIWSMVERHGATTLYTIPTLIRMLKRFGPDAPKQHDISTLRLLGSVGEPIDPETWVWFHKTVGRGECPLLDTWWQTETGAAMIAPLPISLLKPGSVTRPLPGISASVLDDQGNPVPPGKGGHLTIDFPWPSMLLTLDNDNAGYHETYWSRFPGRFEAGDVARMDEDGYIWIQGRSDEVLNIAGHRLGTAELEAALTSHPAVSEAVVIGIPDEIRGEVGKGFLVLNKGISWSETLEDELFAHIRTELGPIAVIRHLEVRKSLPRTRSGKLLRRMLKAEELGADPGDLSTLEE